MNPKRIKLRQLLEELRTTHGKAAFWAGALNGLVVIALFGLAYFAGILAAIGFDKHPVDVLLITGYALVPFIWFSANQK